MALFQRSARQWTVNLAGPGHSSMSMLDLLGKRAATARLDQRVDPDRLFLAVKQQLGIPIDVTREAAHAAAAADAGDDQVAAGE